MGFLQAQGLGDFSLRQVDEILGVQLAEKITQHPPIHLRQHSPQAMTSQPPKDPPDAPDA